MQLALLLVGLAVLAAICWATWHFDAERRFRGLLSERPSLPDEQFGESMGASTPELVSLAIEVRRLAADAIDCPYDKLFPDDEFAWADTTPLLLELQQLFGITLDDADAEKTRPSVRSIAQTVLRLAGTRSQACRPADERL